MYNMYEEESSMKIMSLITSVVLSLSLIFVYAFGIGIWHPSERESYSALTSDTSITQAVEFYNKVLKDSTHYNCKLDSSYVINSTQVIPENKIIENEAKADNEVYTYVNVNQSYNGVDAYLIVPDLVTSYALSNENGIISISFAFSTDSKYAFKSNSEAVRFNKDNDVSIYNYRDVTLRLDSEMKICSLSVEYDETSTVSFDDEEFSADIRTNSTTKDYYDFYGNGGYQAVFNCSPLCLYEEDAE